MEISAPPPKKLTAEDRADNKNFLKEVYKAGGPKGFVDKIKERDEKAKADSAQKADAIMDENVQPYLHILNPRFSFSHVPQNRWDEIFKPKEEESHAQVCGS